MRLIDAEALAEGMYHEAFERDTDMQRWDSGCWIRYKLFEDVLIKTPTIYPKNENISELNKMEEQRNFWKETALSYERTIEKLQKAIEKIGEKTI